jgi:predicted O-linked N-acetylglucosamine transferase (SPINDLY family)
MTPWPGIANLRLLVCDSFIGGTVLIGGVGNADFLAVMAACDVMLDPLHYSGGNTSLEAFSRGTPIVTWPGAFMRARHTLGFYRLMGMDDLVARDWDHYVELALRLGTDRAFQDSMRARILERCPVLFSCAASVVAIEDALESAFEGIEDALESAFEGAAQPSLRM